MGSRIASITPLNLFALSANIDLEFFWSTSIEENHLRKLDYPAAHRRVQANHYLSIVDGKKPILVAILEDVHSAMDCSLARHGGHNGGDLCPYFAPAEFQMQKGLKTRDPDISSSIISLRRRQHKGEVQKKITN